MDENLQDENLLGIEDLENLPGIEDLEDENLPGIVSDAEDVEDEEDVAGSESDAPRVVNNYIYFNECMFEQGLNF